MKFHCSPNKLDTQYNFRKTAMKKRLNDYFFCFHTFLSLVLTFAFITVDICFVCYLKIEKINEEKKEIKYSEKKKRFY